MASSENPNVLLICTDHWPAHLLGAAGHPHIQTPTLDEFCRSGVRFTNAYSECPVCIPARRTLMTGTPPRTHGDRQFKVQEPMPALPTLAQTFRDNGYQAYAAGKLHVFPQRDRIGFDDVMLAEEGRPILGAVDDYDIWLAEQGYPGQQMGHGMNNNDYVWRPWHLPEQTHITNWTTQQMVRLIRRRDPTRPGFWYLSYTHPHPPLAPLQAYLDLYRDVEPELPWMGEWAQDPEAMPYFLQVVRKNWDRGYSAHQLRGIYRAFYALCTHIDHQLRLVIGALREEQILDNTIICFTADHGDMLGNHGLWAKRLFYDNAANVPMLLLGPTGDLRTPAGSVNDRLVGWQDIMPTLLDLAGLTPPETVEGLSMVGAEERDYLYGECGEDAKASRMIRTDRYKLIYYPTGNRMQLFDMQEDPHELKDLSESSSHQGIVSDLTDRLLAELYGVDEGWVHDGWLMGWPDQKADYTVNRGLNGQRGVHWPPPPLDLRGKSVGMP